MAKQETYVAPGAEHVDVERIDMLTHPFLTPSAPFLDDTRGTIDYDIYL